MTIKAVVLPVEDNDPIENVGSVESADTVLLSTDEEEELHPDSIIDESQQQQDFIRATADEVFGSGKSGEFIDLGRAKRDMLGASITTPTSSGGNVAATGGENFDNQGIFPFRTSI